MPDPHVMADGHVMRATPGEEFSFVVFAREIGTGSIGDVGLGYPVIGWLPGLIRVIAAIEQNLPKVV